MSLLRSILLAVTLICGAGITWVSQPALAQAPAPAPAQASAVDPVPAGLTREQYDGLVEAISRAVVERLKQEGIAGKPPSAAPAATAPVAAPVADSAAAEAERLVDRTLAIVGAIPELGRRLAALPGRLDESSRGGMGTWTFLATLLAVAAAALAAEFAVRRAGEAWRTAWADRAQAKPGLAALPFLLGIAAFDFVGLAAMGAVNYGAQGGLFAGTTAQAHFASSVLSSLFAWRLYMLAFRVVTRPGLSGARLAAIDDGAARIIYREVTFVIAGIVAIRAILRTLLLTGTPSEAVSAGQLITGFVILALLLRAVSICREAAGHWFEDLGRKPGRVSLGELAGRNWAPIAICFFVLLTAARIYGIVSFRHSVSAAMVLTLNVVIALIFLETLSDYFTRGSGSVAAGAARGDGRFRRVIARSVRVAALIAAAALVAQTWVVDVLGLVDASGWQSLTRSSVSAAVTMFIAFVVWELVKFVTERSAPGAVSGAHDEDAEGGASASRFATIAPLLRIGLGIAIMVVTLLVVLSELGVNITPLIAGASVFGLAISFGSQTLVRDVVSGIFYLADDAFRVGEYIECGKAKGTVEGFTLRSIRLRHQNGQVHTIPFGQLGQITNFSRDWSTVKFNLRFVRDTDLEKLRKTVKKIGLEMMEDPTIKDNILEPLKMQGVADIADNATIVRFKFTVRPGHASLVQRQSVKRMVSAFSANGIQFASAVVAVQTMGGSQADAASAAAASQIINQAQAVPAS
jgi:small-conductance mechanosensitive channel